MIDSIKNIKWNVNWIRETIQHKKESEKDRKKRSASKGEENKKGKKKPIQRRTCDITIVADHLFFHEIGEGSVEKTVLQMLWHVKVNQFKGHDWFYVAFKLHLYYDTITR